MLTVAVLVAVLVIAELVAVVDEDGAGEEDGARSAWWHSWSSCRNLIVKALPLTAIKTVVVVWQIVTQVLLLQTLNDDTHGI